MHLQVFPTRSVPCGSLGVVSVPSSLNTRPIRVVRERWRHSDHGVVLPRRVLRDGPKVVPGGKVYGEWLAALVAEFGRLEVARWPADRELPSEWTYRTWRGGRTEGPG